MSAHREIASKVGLVPEQDKLTGGYWALKDRLLYQKKTVNANATRNKEIYDSKNTRKTNILCKISHNKVSVCMLCSDTFTLDTVLGQIRPADYITLAP